MEKKRQKTKTTQPAHLGAQNPQYPNPMSRARPGKSQSPPPVSLSHPLPLSSILYLTPLSLLPHVHCVRRTRAPRARAHAPAAPGRARASRATPLAARRGALREHHRPSRPVSAAIPPLHRPNEAEPPTPHDRFVYRVMELHFFCFFSQITSLY